MFQKVALVLLRNKMQLILNSSVPKHSALMILNIGWSYIISQLKKQCPTYDKAQHRKANIGILIAAV
jgi:hypothetical protein